MEIPKQDKMRSLLIKIEHETAAAFDLPQANITAMWEGSPDHITDKYEIRIEIRK